MNKWFVKIVVLFLLTNAIHAQKINFTISSTDSTNLVTVNVLFKEKNTNSILEFTSLKQGKGTYVLKKKYKNLCLEIQCVNYEKENFCIENLEDKIYDVDLKLNYIGITVIEEVVVKKAIPFEIKKDTVVFSVKDYKNSNDKKIEDVLKRLPGIEVESNGVISYRGKKIETINLDGDNVLDANYKLASQNINVDMVDKVEAIDNFTNNPLLKGLTAEGKVALNLKFNKGINQWVVDFVNALGVNTNKKEQYLFHAFVMQLSSKSKALFDLNYNNIGKSESLQNTNSSALGIDKINFDDFNAIKLLETNLFAPDLDLLRYNLNKQLNFSYNNLFKINKKINLKLNVNYFKDKVLSNQNNNQIITLNNEPFFLSDSFFITKKPEIFSFEPNFRYNISKKIIFEYNMKLFLLKEHSQNRYLKNNSNDYVNKLNTKETSNLNRINLSWKINESNFLQFNSYLSSDKTPQTFESLSITENLKQQTQFDKNVFVTNLNFMGKLKMITYFFQFDRDKRNTVFTSNNSNLSENYTRFDFLNHSVLVRFNYKLFSQVQISNSVKFSNLSLRLNDQKQNNLLLEPNIRIDYAYNKNKFFAAYDVTKKTLNDENIFTNLIYKSNRFLIQNTPSLAIQNSEKYTVGYTNLAIGKDRFFNVTSSFMDYKGFYLQTISTNNSQTSITNVFYDLKKYSWTNSFRYSDYFEKTSIRTVFSTSLNFNTYPNLINNSDLRNNSNITSSSYLKVTTGFISKFNFEEKIDYTVLISKFVRSQKVSSISNDFLLMCNINSKNQIKVINNLYLASLETKSKLNSFLDFEYKLILGKKEFYFILNNVLNNRYWRTVSNDDYSTSFSEINLIPRYFLLGFDYGF